MSKKDRESWAQPEPNLDCWRFSLLPLREQWYSGKGLSLRFNLAGEPKMRGPIKSKGLLDSAWWDNITLRRFCLTLIGAFLFWLKGWGENPALHCRAVQQCRNLHAYMVSLNLRLLFPNLSCSTPCPRIPEEQLMCAAAQIHKRVHKPESADPPRLAAVENRNQISSQPETPGVCGQDVWNSSVQDCLLYSQLSHL